MRNLLVLLFAVLACTLVSCERSKKEKYVELYIKPLVVISHTEKGELVDFKVVRDVESVFAIEIYPEEGEGKAVYVTVYGQEAGNVRAEDMAYGGLEFPCVRLLMKEGKADMLMGDGYGVSTLSEEALEEVNRRLAGGETSYKQDSSIKVRTGIPRLEGDFSKMPKPQLNIEPR